MNNDKITSAQLACMLFLSILATSMLTSPSLAYGIAKNDMWMTPLIGSLGGFLTVALSLALYRRYPGCTLIQYSDLILTKWLGKPISLVFLFVCLQMNANQLRQFAELMKLAFMVNTPIIIFAVSMMLVGAIVVNLGIELIGRLSLLFTPIIIIIVAVLILPLIRGMEPDQLLPFMADGAAPILRGAFALQIWFPTYIYAAMFLPYVSDINKARRWLNWGVCWSTTIFTLSFLYIVMSMGAASQHFSYPFLLLSRYVTIASFMTHLDALIMILWVLDVFIRTIVMYYAAVSGFSQWFQLPSYKPITLPVGLLIVLLTFWSIPDITTYNFLAYIVLYYYTLGNICIPLLLYIIALFRSGPAQDEHSPAPSGSGPSVLHGEGTA
ncbi:GerAB/ArcD/ProY family transporter [Paenibacillus kobensis]|uniref:GerAB/ArcD/ProY family transporter n=1 Tax=Paenibacillus kobensis TaxID=59841 RepID=UPI000FD714CB|nr:endospore germination permease [Paenibacillus kobensis]